MRELLRDAAIITNLFLLAAAIGVGIAKLEILTNG
jgi:hypothetical protein